MSIEQVIESTKKLSSSEKALLAHCLISGLDTIQDEGVEEAWAELAKKRFDDLASGRVKGVSWGNIKDKLKDLD